MPEQPVRLIQKGEIEPALTQALYHSLAEQMDESSPDTIILCRPSRPYLCIGYHQVLDSVLDSVTSRLLDFEILRRRVGGGATYLDQNQVFYQCIFHCTRVPLRTDQIYRMMLTAPVRLLQKLGLNGKLRSINEVEANGLRVAGIGGGRIGEAMVVVGNLLLDFDYKTMARVWRVPHSAFRELAASTLKERITTLRKQGCRESAEKVQAGLAEEFAKKLDRPLVPGELSSEEMKQAERNMSFLASPEFLQLHHTQGPVAPMNSLKIAADVYIHAKRFTHQGKDVEIAVRSDQGIITALLFNSAKSEELEELRSRMLGTPENAWN